MAHRIRRQASPAHAEIRADVAHDLVLAK